MSTQALPGQLSDMDMSDWPGSPLSTLHPAAAAAQPIRTEQYTQDQRYVVRFELPGVDPVADLEVSTEAQVLTVHAERRPARHGSERSEFRYGPFSSHVTLPAGTDDTDVTATYVNGILEVSIGMAHPHPIRSVQVTTPQGGEARPDLVSGGTSTPAN
jgi:HSP20 family protein